MNKHASKGFTLIELMIVVTIIGILAAIAIPKFQEYRQSVFQQTVQSDIRQAATAEEAHLAMNQNYISFGPATGPSILQLSSDVSIRISKNVTIQGVTNATATAVTITATHPGAKTPINYSSTVGSFTTP